MIGNPRYPTPPRLLLLLSGVALVVTGSLRADVPLPGTQPEEGRITLGNVSQCRMCHARTASGPLGPFESWQGGMMAQAARDPVFRAALAIANQDIPGVGEYCLRCHTPSAWLEGRSKPPDGKALNRDDLHGVSCAACHQLIDPKAPEAVRFAKQLPPSPGNAMMVMDRRPRMRGPYRDDRRVGPRPHEVEQSAFTASGHLCGTCHDVSNPLQARDPATQPAWAYGHIERTYSEWLLSEFAGREKGGSCQSCHYPRVPGGGSPTSFTNRPRAYFVEHGPVGGSTWVQQATWLVWNGRDMNRLALKRGQRKARKLLQTAATLELSFPAPGRATLRITNNTGHKLPSGYPEGRRMWLNIRYYNGEGLLIDELGRYGERDDTLAGDPVRVPTLLDPQRTRVYENRPGISPAQAARYGMKAGPSFHFVLNDVITKDNRIPPRGFANAAFAEHQCQPVGATYADGQHWDIVTLELPPETTRVEARLMYQSVSWEYVKFLVEENHTDTWGRRLYEAWDKTGRCPPEVIASTVATP